MTTVGHTIVGLSLGLACMPSCWRRTSKAALLLVFALLANLPDWPLPHWGHFAYWFSHSLLCNAIVAVVIVLAAAVLPKARRAVGGWPVALLAGAAVLSHLLLDSFYRDDHGVMIGWPFSKFHLNLSMPWFATLPRGWQLTPETLRIVMIELAFYSPLLLICLLARTLILRHRSTKIVKGT